MNAETSFEDFDDALPDAPNRRDDLSAEYDPFRDDGDDPEGAHVSIRTLDELIASDRRCR